MQKPSSHIIEEFHFQSYHSYSCRMTIVYLHAVNAHIVHTFNRSNFERSLHIDIVRLVRPSTISFQLEWISYICTFSILTAFTSCHHLNLKDHHICIARLVRPANINRSDFQLKSIISYLLPYHLSIMMMNHRKAQGTAFIRAIHIMFSAAPH